jgi:hypothetical protein
MARTVDLEPGFLQQTRLHFDRAKSAGNIEATDWLK